jgi:hypothetical protein
MARSRKKKDPTDARIEKAYYRTCSGVQINIMDISKVFDHGRKGVETGADDETLGVELRRFVDTISLN